MRKMAQQGGFSLIELLVVLVILGLLAGIVGPQLFKQIEKGKAKTTRTNIANLETTLSLFRIDVGRFPTTEEGLSSLRKDPGSAKRWAGPYLTKPVPLDGWEQELHYKFPGEHGEYDLFSYARDNTEGATEDLDFSEDIVSWK